MNHTSGRNNFDYVILGAGSAGCLLAERLSRNPAHRVALIEAGPEYDAWPLRVPAALPLLLRSRRYNWAFDTVPQLELVNRRLYWPRGKVLGGSSSINAMCAVRGPAHDFDLWSEYGGTPWSWAELEPLLGDITTAEPDSHPNRLAISPLRYRHPISEAFVAAAHEAGHPALPDFNVDIPDGVGFYPVFQREGERWENARAFLEPARDRNNLAVLTEARVLKVEIDSGSRATGVLVQRSDDSRHTVSARNEVILCCGTIGTPHLLMLSGIGPPEEIQRFGIEVRHALPGVGRNLQDHLDLTLVSYAKGGGISARPQDLPGKLRAFFDYRLSRTGPFTSNLAEAGGFIRSDPALARPDLQLHFLPAVQQDHGRKLVRTTFFAGCALHVCGLYPASRGRLGLASPDPMVDPLIDPRYLSAESDLRTLVSGVRRALDILRQPAFTPWRLRPFIPRNPPIEDVELETLVRQRAETIYHPVGTCRFGTDGQAVVDPELRVHGVRNLRVADASVMPTLIGANTNIAATLIAENAARLLLADS
ncbi:MAG: GMC family oxidoreductase N-terminal domain-containing protein [Gammaproteobacteria bacterium]